MRRYTTIPVLLGVVLAFAGITQAAPEWAHANGLDFWNGSSYQTELRHATGEVQTADDQFARAHRRTEITTDIVSSACDGRMTLNEALDALLALAQTSPDWLAGLRCGYRGKYGLSFTPTDREVMSCYLVFKIESLRAMAIEMGNTAHAAFLSDRLASIEEELRLQTKPPTSVASAH